MHVLKFLSLTDRGNKRTTAAFHSFLLAYGRFSWMSWLLRLKNIGKLTHACISKLLGSFQEFPPYTILKEQVMACSVPKLCSASSRNPADNSNDVYKCLYWYLEVHLLHILHMSFPFFQLVLNLEREMVCFLGVFWNKPVHTEMGNIKSNGRFNIHLYIHTWLHIFMCVI